MTLHNLFADGQSKSCSEIFIFPVQTVECNEYLVCILGIDTDTVIPYTDNPIVLPLFTKNFDERGFILS
jgi:hypothetical protein